MQFFFFTITSLLRVETKGCRKIVKDYKPDYQNILKGEGVVSHFESLWQETKRFALENKSRHCVREYGCVVFYDVKNKTYLFEDVIGEEYILNSTFKKADITFTIEDDVPLHPHSEKNTYKYHVATFHTHPPLIGADNTFESELPSGPSTADINNLEKGFQMPVFVYCYKNTVDKYSKIDDAAGIVIVKENYQRRVIKLN